MVKYTCETCGQTFQRKALFSAHTCKNVPNLKVPKPLLKWVGGKTQIIDKIIAEFPSNMNNYHEPFLGGGSVLLALLSCIKNETVHVHGKIFASDTNEPLIYLYKNIQCHHEQLFEQIGEFVEEYNSCENGEINRTPSNLDEAKQSKENYYYWIRSKYNQLSSGEKTSILGSAMFLFMNKTCFRGVFRMGPHGFNVPFGHYDNPEIINKQHLDEIHELVQNVIFECHDFSDALNFVEQNDFVYLDPPYAPETKTSFVNYTVSGFDTDSHAKLFSTIHQLTETNKKILLSNADVDLVRNNFANEKYQIISIECKRTIHSKNPKAKANEVIIKNY